MTREPWFLLSAMAFGVLVLALVRRGTRRARWEAELGRHNGAMLGLQERVRAQGFVVTPRWVVEPVFDTMIYTQFEWRERAEDEQAAGVILLTGFGRVNDVHLVVFDPAQRRPEFGVPATYNGFAPPRPA